MNEKVSLSLFEHVSFVVYAMLLIGHLQGAGSAYGGKVSRLTTVDRGAGYDASDSFIDDTEAVRHFLYTQIIVCTDVEQKIVLKIFKTSYSLWLNCKHYQLKMNYR